MNRTYNDKMFIETFEREYTWLSGFMRNVRRYGKRLAVLDPAQGKSWTYEQLNAESNKLALALIKAGVQKDDVVMIALRNCPAFCFAYAGVRKSGAILLAANYNLASGEMAALIDRNRPKVLLYSANVTQTVAAALQSSSHKVELALLADNIEAVPLPEGHTSYEHFTEGTSGEDFVLPFVPNIYDEVVRLCTSGTSSLPKSVPVNNICEVLTAHDVIMQCALTSTDITLNMTPWFHRGGCHSAGPCPVFYVGGAVAAMRVFQPKTALEWIAHHGVTFMIGAPASLKMICKAQRKSPRNLESLRALIAMGSPLSKDDCIECMESLTPNVFNGYGTTETFWNSMLLPRDLPEHSGSAGISCIDDEIRVVRLCDEGRAEPDDTVAKDGATQGEVIIKSPAKSTYAYIADPTNEAEKFYKGWMYTGDTGTWDSQSYVTIKGRKDDMMIVSGENIYPTQIEEAVNRCPKVKDSAATSVPDKIRGQAIVVYVIAKEGEELTLEEVRDWCDESPDLSVYKRPRYFAFIDSIPATATGKKLRNQIKQKALDDLNAGSLKKL